MVKTFDVTVSFTPQEYADIVDGNAAYAPEQTLKEYLKDSILRMNKDNIQVCEMLLTEAPPETN